MVHPPNPFLTKSAAYSEVVVAFLSKNNTVYVWESIDFCSATRDVLKPDDCRSVYSFAYTAT